MIFLMHNGNQVTTLQDRVEAYEKYFASKNVAATYEGFGEFETAEDYMTPEESMGWVGAQIWFKLVCIRARGQRSTITLEPNLEYIISPSPESPFDMLDELRNEDEKVLEIISHVRSHLKVSFAQQLADRIMFLVEIAKEEHPDEVAILPESLRNFVSFLQLQTNLTYPDVMLTPSKNIRVQWRTAPNRHFAVEFLATGEANFVIFSPDPRHPERTIRLSGIVSVDSLMEAVQPHGVLAWSAR
jgi:hypothetical protein